MVRRSLPYLITLLVCAAVVLGIRQWAASLRADPPSALPPDPAGRPAADPGGGTTGAESPAGAPVGDTPVIVALGDSLTAGQGVPPDQAYPAQLEQALRSRGFPHRVINHGVSGDTTAGGLTRLNAALREQPEILILALGYNDAFRGVPAASVRHNLEEIIRRSRAAGVQVVLAGIYLPPNLGEIYGREFRAIYDDLAEQYDLPYIDFFLDGVAASWELNQDDGIHPTAAGYKVIVEQNVLPVLLPLLEK